jgi:hypothetical protein
MAVTPVQKSNVNHLNAAAIIIVPPTITTASSIAVWT